ncbi:hypothetical protein TRAPUB_962 [Trametes pubescens]|uniref:C2H2-type domain-containing protein n=1 Tax=Trametes pubescens TaxID=154538 RepID=A0A1M2VKK8_TRAPU|nr:hypothetical protein TRAPUB_962 [Trametes pubescens]
MQSYPNDTLLDASLEIVSGDYRRRLPSNEHSVENIPPINENETFQTPRLIPMGQASAPRWGASSQQISAEVTGVHSTSAFGQTSNLEFLTRSGQPSPQDPPVLPDHIWSSYPDHVPLLYSNIGSVFPPDLSSSEYLNPPALAISGHFQFHPQGPGIWQDANPTPIPQMGDNNPYGPMSSFSGFLPMEESHLGPTTGLYLCDKCHQSFTRKWNRDQHVLDVHGGRRRFRCEQCNRQPYSRKHDLKRHVERDHRPSASPL